MAEQAVYGGHDQEFVCKVADRFICQVCTKVLREPHLAVCCGQHFCESCLNEWFDRQQSCPHCRAEGFHHVINKGLRSEINELKIKCSHHREGCEWRGELGALKTHLESQNGCGYEYVECPNKCESFPGLGDILTFQRKYLKRHLTCDCYLRPYQCEFCGHKDTYKGITGQGIEIIIGPGYFGHQATCPEVPLACSNRCGSKGIKRKDMDSHHSKCPQEPVECPFAEAGCTGGAVRRSQLENHMTSSLQQHLMLVMKDSKETKRKLAKTEEKLSKALSRLSVAEDNVARSQKLEKTDDFVKLIMCNFSEYRRSGKLWYSPPFYYREGYKMCLAVYANGVGEGAGTHISLSLLLLRGEYDDKLKWPTSFNRGLHYVGCHRSFGRLFIHMCHLSIPRPAMNELKQIKHDSKFCPLVIESDPCKLVDNCFTLKISLYNECWIEIKIV